MLLGQGFLRQKGRCERQINPNQVVLLHAFNRSTQEAEVHSL